MIIQSVMANRDGGFSVTFSGGASAEVGPLDQSKEAIALAKWFANGNKADPYVPPEPTLNERKIEVMREVRSIASTIRVDLAVESPPERVSGWILKTVFAVAQSLDGPDVDTMIADLAALGTQGFALEAGITGEADSDARELAIQRVGAMFLGLQLVEGMERLAEIRVPDAGSLDELDTTIAELRALEAQAREQLATVTS